MTQEKLDNKRITDHIANVYYDLTKAEKQVADYIMKHASETQYHSITELAVACNTAESTITRFCRTLGLNGFHALKLALAKSEMMSDESERDAAKGNDEGDVRSAAGTIILNEMNQNLEAIRQTFEMFNEKEYLKAVDKIRNANHVYCMGQGGGVSMAEELKSIFLTITPKFSVVKDFHSQILTTSLLGEKDLLIYFSYSGATVEIMEVLNLAEKVKCPSILITRFAQSPAAKKASVVLQFGSNEPILKSGSMAARFAQLQVISWIFELSFRKDKESSMEKREQSMDCLAGRMI